MSDLSENIAAGALWTTVLLVFFACAGIIFLAAAFAGLGGGISSGNTDSTGSGTCDISKEEAYKLLDQKADEPPKFLIPVYQGAADKYKLGEKGPSILAGHHKQETNFGRSTLPGVRDGENGSGAGGPMQFLAPTWAAYKVDGNGDGKADRYDTVDAIFGAANYLKALGAPGDWRGAIASYYGADVDGYVDSVLNYAEKYDLPGPAPCAGSSDSGNQDSNSSQSNGNQS